MASELIKKGYALSKCEEAAKNVTDKQVFADLMNFATALDWNRKTASKRTHYNNLDEWSNEVYGYVHKMLDKYGFVNGDVEANSKNTNALFWWEVYGLVSSVCYSPLLPDENTAPHHASAWARNEALCKEVTWLSREFKDYECPADEK